MRRIGPCLEFARGRCTRGWACSFSHERVEEFGGERMRERSRSRKRLDLLPARPEQSSSQESLKLLKDAVRNSTSREWEPFIVDTSLRSFSYVLRREDTGLTHEEMDRWWASLHPSNVGVRCGAWTQAIPSRYGQRKRQTAWYVQPPCVCAYAYGRTHQPAATDGEFCRTINEVSSRISQVLGIGVPNSVNLNFYEPGGGYAFHADDEELFDGLHRDACIISFSLAGSDAGDRWFEVKRKSRGGKKGKYAGKGEIIHKVKLRHGDIMTMEGHFQRYWLHSVWPGDRHLLEERGHSAHGERINFSWRTIVNHSRACPLS